MTSTRERLVAKLTELSRLLEAHGVQHWASWIEHDAELVGQGDDQGVQHFLRAFGGMGSLNDLIVHPANGHRIQSEQVDQVNEQLSRLTDEAYQLARALL